MYSLEEKRGLTKLINDILKEDEDLKGVLPINEDDDSIFTKVGNGIIFW